MWMQVSKPKCQTDHRCRSDHRPLSLQYINQNQVEIEIYNRVKKNEEKLNRAV